MKTNTILFVRLFLLGFAIPIIMGTIVYVGFTTNYTAEVFSRQGFERYYGHGIYKYRILSPVMLLKTYDLIKRYNLPTITPRSLALMDHHGDPQFYSAYFYLNTFFHCLTCIVLLFLLGADQRQKDFTKVDLPLLSISALIALTQYVIVPYDTLSYFLLCFAAGLIIYDSKAVWRLPLLCITIILATLIRETSVFILIFYLSVYHGSVLTIPQGLKLNERQVELLITSFCFLGTYVGLRVAFGYEHAIYQTYLLSRNLNLSYSLLGMIFFASIALLVITTRSVTKEIFVFAVATLPYAIFILLFADPWEIRLWIPIALPLIILKVRASESEIVPNVLHRLHGT